MFDLLCWDEGMSNMEFSKGILHHVSGTTADKRSKLL
jgi:hypothetical protein